MNCLSRLSLRFSFGARPSHIKLLTVMLCAAVTQGVDAIAQVTVSPSSITWAKVTVGQAGGPKAVTLTNNNAVTVTISSIAFTGTNAGDFAIYQNNCGPTLTPSATCTTTILFKPTNIGTRTATLLFTDSDGTSPQEVSVSGTGAGSVTAAPVSLSFGSVNTGASSGPQSITITNTTSSSVALGAESISGTNAAEFSASTNCGSTLAASTSCVTNIVFAPTAAGTASATWSLTEGSSTSLTVSLSGTGTTSSGGTATALPSSIAWASVAVGNAGGPKTVTLTNNGSASVTISSIAFTGTDPGDFSIYKNACGSMLAGSSNCAITILFRPTTAGSRTATLTFTDSDPSSPQQVSVSGTGTGGTSSGSVTVSPASLSFGSVEIGSASGSQSITVTNGTAAAVTLSAATVTGANARDFVINSTNCGSTLPASANCTAVIVFQPSIAGAETAVWSLTDSSSATPLSVSLAGTGTTSGSESGSGTTYYVSDCGTIGSDSNSGTSTSSPWLTIAKVNSSTFNPGDSILFNDGCMWREELNLPSPGTSSNPITVGSYGSGTPPVISGSTLATGWIAEPQGGNSFIDDPNLQAYWDMDQVSGSSFLDSSGHGNNLTNVNGVTQVASQFAGYEAAAFTPSAKTMLTIASSALSAGFIGNAGTTNTNVTVGGWVYFNSIASNMSFFLKGTGKAWGLFLGVGSNAGKMEWQTYLNSGYRLVASNSVLTPGAWYHVVGRVNAATDEQALFINGIKQGSTYSTSNTTMFTDATPVNIGGSSGGAYLDGDVDDLFVFNRALSDSEIAEIYNSGFEGSAGSYNLYYVTGFSEPTVVYENGVAMTAATQKSGMTQSSWWWDATDSRVYLRPAGDVNPSTETIEVPQRSGCITDYRNYTTINGLTCQEAAQQGVYVTGSNVTVQNMLVQHLRSNNPATPNNNSYGVGIFWLGSNDNIEYNTVTDANWGIFSDAPSGATVNAGLVQSNTVYNIAYDGIGLAVSAVNGGVLFNTVAQYNVVYNVGIYGAEGGAIECIYAGSTIGTGNAIRYNLVYNNGTPTLHSYPLNVQGGAGSCSFYGNLVYNNYGPCFEVASGPGGNNFYNNVCYNNGLSGGEGAGIFLTGGSSNTGNQIENNIVYAGTGSTLLDVASGTASGNSFNYNIYYGGSATPFVWNGTPYSLSSYQAASDQDAQSLNANPEFNNPSANDFTLTSSSPAIGAGVNLGPAYQFDLQPGSVWPANVSTANQNNYSNWTIGAYVYSQGNP